MARRLPSPRAVAIACAAVVLAGVAAVVGLTVWANGPTPADAREPAASAGPAVPGATPSGTPAPGTTGAGGAAATGPDGAASSDPAPAPSDASELEPGTARTIAPQPPPSPAPTGPSLTGPLPATASARGTSLVAGFPEAVVPVLDGVRVVSSSVAGEGDRLQVGLEASSDADPATVASRYAATFRGAGFAVASSPAVAGSTATAFTRGPDGVVLTVTDRVGGGTELTLAGTLTTAG